MYRLILVSLLAPATAALPATAWATPLGLPAPGARASGAASTAATAATAAAPGASATASASAAARLRKPAGLPPGSFPDSARPLSDRELTRRLNNRVFDAALADGSTWRLEYLSNGRFFLETNRGDGGKGLWQAESGRLCNQLIGQARQCLEVRLDKDTLLVRRSDTEIVKLIAQ